MIAHCGIFLSTQLMAVILDSAKFGFLITPVKGILLGIDILAILIVIWISIKVAK